MAEFVTNSSASVPVERAAIGQTFGLLGAVGVVLGIDSGLHGYT
jgi:hypothetical protein